MEEPISDGVGQRGLAEVIVPLGRWQLAGDDPPRRGEVHAVPRGAESVTPPHPPAG